MANKVDKSLPWSVPWHFGEFHFCFRHPLPCRGLESHWRTGIFAGQFFVGEPPSKCRARSFDEATAIVVLSFIVSESLFIKVAEEMEGLDAYVGSFDSPLEQRPEILNSICVYAAAYVLFP